LFCFEFSRTVLKKKKIQREREKEREGKIPTCLPRFPSFPSPFGCKQVGSRSLNVSDYKSEVGRASGGQPLFAGGQAAVGHPTLLPLPGRAVPAAEEPRELTRSPPPRAAAAAAALGSLLIAPKAFSSSERRPPAWLGDPCFAHFPVFQAEPIPSREAFLPLRPPP